MLWNSRAGSADPFRGRVATMTGADPLVETVDEAVG
jgi:hypothetical protein